MRGVSMEAGLVVIYLDVMKAIMTVDEFVWVERV